MKVWLMHIGESLPGDAQFRPFRYSWLARSLVEAGHDVVRWAPTFSHVHKTRRSPSDRRVQAQDGYALELLHAGGYSSNVGVPRLLFNARFARRLAARMPRMERPDLIVAAIPSPETAWVATRYGREQAVPVIVDVRDLWPDLFLTPFPPLLRRAANGFLAPWRRAAIGALRSASGIVGVSEDYLQWGLRRAGRARRDTDRVFPLGHPRPSTEAEAPETTDFLDRLGIRPGQFLCTYSGLFERSCDLDTVVEAARMLRIGGRRDIRFVLCGAGSRMADLKELARGLDNVVFTGWVSPEILSGVFRRSAVGLASYSGGAMQGLPNKVMEYMANGLFIVSSLGGECSRLLASEGCGATHAPEDHEALASILSGLHDDVERLESGRARARDLHHRSFDSEMIYPAMTRHLESLR